MSTVQAGGGDLMSWGMFSWHVLSLGKSVPSVDSGSRLTAVEAEVLFCYWSPFTSRCEVLSSRFLLPCRQLEPDWQFSSKPANQQGFLQQSWCSLDAFLLFAPICVNSVVCVCNFQEDHPIWYLQPSHDPIHRNTIRMFDVNINWRVSFINWLIQARPWIKPMSWCTWLSRCTDQPCPDLSLHLPPPAQSCQGHCGEKVASCSCHPTCETLLNCCADVKQFCLDISPHSGSLLGGTDFKLLNVKFDKNLNLTCRYAESQGLSRMFFTMCGRNQ